MRIAFIGHKRIPSREGGIEIVVDELATRMVARGEQVVVYNRKGHNVAGEEFDNQSSTSDKPYMYRGVKVIPVTTIDAKGLAALTSSFFATLKAIKARPDVISTTMRRARACRFVWRIGPASVRSPRFTVWIGSVRSGAGSPPCI